MLQTVDGRPNVYVVDFDTMPELPITWDEPEEELYARALHASIANEVITEPGKYGIVVTESRYSGILAYDIFKIEE